MKPVDILGGFKSIYILKKEGMYTKQDFLLKDNTEKVLIIRKHFTCLLKGILFESLQFKYVPLHIDLFNGESMHNST